MRKKGENSVNFAGKAGFRPTKVMISPFGDESQNRPLHRPCGHDSLDTRRFLTRSVALRGPGQPYLARMVTACLAGSHKTESFSVERTKIEAVFWQLWDFVPVISHQTAGISQFPGWQDHT